MIMKDFEIRIHFEDHIEKHWRECEDPADARYEAEEIIEECYTKNGHLITRYDVVEITD